MVNRTEYYFEYPSLVTMLVREVRYGINLGLMEVTIAPFGPTDFSYHVGNVSRVLLIQYDDRIVQQLTDGSLTCVLCGTQRSTWTMRVQQAQLFLFLVLEPRGSD